MQRLSEPDLIGTARYVGLAGAMTAVGGDPTAIQDNPAGLGIYRRFEAAISFAGRFSYTSVLNRNRFYSDRAFILPQATFIFAFGNEERDRGMIFNNVSFSYYRLASYNRQYGAVGTSRPSAAEQMAASAAGVSESAMGATDNWDNINIGWLSILGYNTYMIDPLSTETARWKPYSDWYKSLSVGVAVREAGYMDQYNITWAGNISNRWYIGAGVNIRSLYYSKASDYTELTPVGGTATIRSQLTERGVGVNATVGAMWHPVRFCRIGLSFRTPSIVTTTVRSYGTAATEGIYDNGQTDRFYSETPTSNERQKMRMPLNLSVGTAFIIRRAGLISLQYDYQDDVDAPAYHSVRFGMEWAIRQQFFFDFGTACSLAVGYPKYVKRLADNDVRTDMDWAVTEMVHHFSAAFGYRGHFGYVQLGYKFATHRTALYAPVYSSNRIGQHDIVLTLGWHSRR